MRSATVSDMLYSSICLTAEKACTTFQGYFLYKAAPDSQYRQMLVQVRSLRTRLLNTIHGQVLLLQCESGRGVTSLATLPTISLPAGS